MQKRRILERRMGCRVNGVKGGWGVGAKDAEKEEEKREGKSASGLDKSRRASFKFCVKNSTGR